jgi:hypothetical protein
LGSVVIRWKNGITSGSWVTVVVGIGSGTKVFVGMRVGVGLSAGTFVKVLDGVVVNMGD